MLDDWDKNYVAEMAQTIARETRHRTDDEMQKIIGEVTGGLRRDWSQRMRPDFIDEFAGALATAIMAERAALGRRVN